MEVPAALRRNPDAQDLNVGNLPSALRPGRALCTAEYLGGHSFLGKTVPYFCRTTRQGTRNYLIFFWWAVEDSDL